MRGVLSGSWGGGGQQAAADSHAKVVQGASGPRGMGGIESLCGGISTAEPRVLWATSEWDVTVRHQEYSALSSAWWEGKGGNM